MSGIIAAVAGTGQNVIYANGLYNTTYGVELSPIDIGTQTSQFSGTVTLSWQWIGYYKPAVSTAVTLGAICNYQEYYQISSGGGATPYNWGGGGNSTCYIWTGNTAKSGYNSGNYTALIQNGTSGTNFTATANTYVPMRIQWSTYLPYSFYTFIGGYVEYFAQSNFTFLIGGSSSVSGRIWYNTLTNGF
jgi:hypothetical protein